MTRDLFGAAHRIVTSLRPSARARGDAARDAGNWPLAIDAYETHLAATPEDTAIWVQLGHAYKEAGEFDDALRAYMRAEALTPDDADLLLNLGHLHTLRGRPDLSLAAYGKSTSLAPGLFGGAAMVARERILGRITWRSADGATPGSLPDLVAAITEREQAGLRIFQNYYASFEAR